MYIAVDGKIMCSDGHYGKITNLLVNPKAWNIEYLVVRKNRIDAEERIVPIENVSESNDQVTTLSATIAKLDEMQPFKGMKYVKRQYGAEYPGDVVAFEETTLATHASTVENETVGFQAEMMPTGTMAITEDTDVVSADDVQVGKADEVIVKPDNFQITHLVMKKGHLWGKKEVIITMVGVDWMDEDHIYLKLSEKAVRELPDQPADSWWD